MSPDPEIQPSLSDITALILKKAGNLIPVYAELDSDTLTPIAAYLKLLRPSATSHGLTSPSSSYSTYNHQHARGQGRDAASTDDGADQRSPSFLFESIAVGDGSPGSGSTASSRYSFIGFDPFKVRRTGALDPISSPGQQHPSSTQQQQQPNDVDPLCVIEHELSKFRYVPSPNLPTFTGGAVGYITYEAVRHFEPKALPTFADLEDSLRLPESFHMFCDTLVVFDHLFSTVKVVTHIYVPTRTPSSIEVREAYDLARARINATVGRLTDPTIPDSLEDLPLDVHSQEGVSNTGKSGYTAFVQQLKAHIKQGDIIQAVPSQRISRPTSLHPFSIYRHLRRVNPSPYMFYMDCGDHQLVGASPETLCKTTQGGVVENHAIAGTVKRGASIEEDEKAVEELTKSEKDRAEHVMLVDLARNDVNRVCQPQSVKVVDLMKVQKFSHVIHLTSLIRGLLREGKNRYDAFRSIFPAGTVSGAPKIKAIQLVSGLEKTRRGVYAGAVGYWAFDKECMDTCIAIRTMVIKDGVVHLQAGGGIVADSQEDDEYMETVNKLGANLKCINAAEAHHLRATEQRTTTSD